MYVGYFNFSGAPKKERLFGGGGGGGGIVRNFDNQPLYCIINKVKLIRSFELHVLRHSGDVFPFLFFF